MTTAAVIGVGAMGSAFVERFHEAGLQTVVYDVSRAAVDRAVAAGSRAASSPAEAARLANIVDVMVLNDEQVLQVVLGRGGVLEGMGPLGAGNASKIVKNMVTGSERLVIAEGLRIAEAAGVPYPKILELLRTAWHESVVEHWKDVFDASGGNTDPVPSEVLFGKDIPLAEELAADYGVDVPIVRELAAAGRRLQEAARARRVR